jgi:hypothetical protein
MTNNKKCKEIFRKSVISNYLPLKRSPWSTVLLPLNSAVTKMVKGVVGKAAELMLAVT